MRIRGDFMYIRVPEELITLSDIFKKNKETLYIVGGYIRNQILGISDKYNVDIDVCSSALPEKVIKMLEGTEFKTKFINESLGVIEINNNIRVEYATFRREKYAFSGVHLPDNIEFIKNVEEDALRRDFRCNAIYYDIDNKEIIDPLDGVLDVEKRIIRTTRKPEDVFKDDAERILRLVRFSCTLGLKIEEKTYVEAKNNVYKLKYLSGARKRDEFSRIVLADTKYPMIVDNKYAHAKGLLLLSDLGALKYILPAIHTIKESNIIEDKGKYLFEHILNVFAFSKPQVRLSALMHDVGKAKSFLKNRTFNGADEFAEVIIEKNLGQEGLNYSKKVVDRVKRVVLNQNFNKYCLESAKNIKLFIQKNVDIIELIIWLKDSIALDKSNQKRKSISASILYKTYQKMKRNDTPFSLNELNLKGDKLISEIPNLKINKVGEILNKLLLKCVCKPYYNKEDTLLILSKRIINKNKDIYLER